MNRIERIDEKNFKIILNYNEENEMIFSKNGIDYDIWYEKKINDFHLRLNDEIFNICGRKYFRISKFDKSDFIEFENKEERRVLENRRYKSIYGVNCEDLNNYDLVIDVDSFIDYYLINELFKNVDVVLPCVPLIAILKV